MQTRYNPRFWCKIYDAFLVAYMTSVFYVDCEEKIMPGEGDEAPRDKKRRMIELFPDSAYAHLRSIELLNSVIKDLKRDGFLVEK